MGNLEESSANDWSEVVNDSAESTKLFAKVFLSERFSRPFASITDQIFELIDDPSKQKVAIVASRGWGKTSINTIALPLRNIAYRLKNFIVPVTATATKAVMEASNLKAEIESNILVNATFPGLRSSKWASDAFVAGETYVLPRGAGQQIRGLNWLGKRPDLIICDDLEETEAVQSEEQRAKLKNWFFSDLMGSVDRGSLNWKVIIVGTILHEDSLLMHILRDPTWHVVNIPLCDYDLNSNWPEYMDNDKVKKLYEEYKSQGQADAFAREYQNLPMSTEDGVFKEEYFKYYDPTELLDNNNLTFCTIIDPAKTVKLHSADSAVVTLAVDQFTHKIYVHDVSAGKFHPDELYNIAFEHVQLHGSRILAIEVTSLHEFITQPIQNEINKRGIPVHFMELHARAKKEWRIAQLSPFYRSGYIYHNRAVTYKLETQLKSFPKSELWDVMDATAYIIELMDADERFFLPVEYTQTGNEAEYANISSDEEELKAKWRIL